MKTFHTISETAALLGEPPHVLRFWEAKYGLSSMRSPNGRRYYRAEDIALLRGIKALLREQLYTTAGVQKILRERGASYVRLAQ